MPSKFFSGNSAHDRQSALDLFHQAYGLLSTGYALCDGLEIVTANSTFNQHFGLPENGKKSIFLNRLIFDQSGIDRLFAYTGKAIDFYTPDKTTLTIHPWGPCSHFWLLEMEDRTTNHGLRQRLAFAQSHDLQSGTLTQKAFAVTLSRQMQAMSKARENGLLCQVKFYREDNRRSGLENDERDMFVADVATRLQEEFGKDCLISRRDTLALSLFLKNGGSGHEERHILNEIRRIGLHQVQLSGVQLATSISSAKFPEDAMTLSHLQVCANLAAKAAEAMPGKACRVVQFDPKLHEAHAQRQQLAADMRGAIREGQIAPHFQPVINPVTGAILSFEALIRWHHPSLGRVSPPKIISIAGELGLLEELTTLTMRNAATQAKRWPDHVRFAVNVTPSQLHSELVNMVRKTVRDADIDPGRLEIEVTEDALISDFDTTARIFSRLRAVGVSIAMDDFGAGYTSMGNMRLLNFDKIKIDKSISDGLPDDPRSVAIVRSLMVLARELHVAVTVEGIENENQLAFLRDYECGVQGFVYSPALPASQLHELKRFSTLRPKEKNDKQIIEIPGKILDISARKTGFSAGTAKAC